MIEPRSDLDSPWKYILRAYLPEGLSFFFPLVFEQINWKRSPEFLDKEFGQIAKEAEIGKRYADQLIKVWIKDESELWLLIHLEVQSQRESVFAERMFTYSLRIFDRFQRIPVSLAILCDASPSWRPTRYRVELPYTVHDFEFGSIKLLDYQDDWSSLELSNNPFSVVVMAHLKVLETEPDQRERKDWKIRLVRGLYDRGYGRQDILDLYRFIDWLMALPDALEQECWEELKAFERERKMAYVTSGERIGYRRGLTEGIERERSLVLRLLQRKLGSLPSALESRIQDLELPEIERLGEDLLDFSELSDLDQWLRDRE